jgi:hypothetical protein
MVSPPRVTYCLDSCTSPANTAIHLPTRRLRPLPPHPAPLGVLSCQAPLRMPTLGTSPTTRRPCSSPDNPVLIRTALCATPSCHPFKFTRHNSKWDEHASGSPAAERIARLALCPGLQIMTPTRRTISSCTTLPAVQSSRIAMGRQRKGEKRYPPLPPRGLQRFHPWQCPPSAPALPLPRGVSLARAQRHQDTCCNEYLPRASHSCTIETGTHLIADSSEVKYVPARC